MSDGRELPSLVLKAGDRWAYERRQSPRDFSVFLYPIGSTRSSRRNDRAPGGESETILRGRLPVILKCLAICQARVNAGASRESIDRVWLSLRNFMRWLDSQSVDLSLESVRLLYQQWVAHLNRRVQRQEIQVGTAYTQANSLSVLFAEILDTPVNELRNAAHLKRPVWAPRLLDRQDLSKARAFGQDLLDVLESLTPESLSGPWPVLISLRSTKEIYPQWGNLESQAGFPDVEMMPTRTYAERVKAENRRRRDLDTSLASRYSVINLRLTAEFCLFLAATGMNQAQAQQLRIGSLRTQTLEDVVEFTGFKNRAGHDVTVGIWRDYRPWFERYLTWRRVAFPDDYSDRLFFTIRKGDRGAPPEYVSVHPIQTFLKGIGRPWLSARALRETKGNFIRRIGGSDVDVANALQNTPEVVRRHYLRLDLQKAFRELSQYAFKVDPAASDSQEAVAPGACVDAAIPTKVGNVVEEVPDPDCANPAGCWFCRFHRLVDSFDCVWAALSERKLALLQWSTHQIAYGEAASPARMLIERIDDALAEFRHRSSENDAWYLDAATRVDDDVIHPHWMGRFQAARQVGM